MRIDQTVLYEEFVQAREAAVRLMDRYRAAPTDAPDRDLLWARVVDQTEEARLLLESWLHEVESADEERELLTLTT
jgi:hypothetical protein